jgi:hypothetical protein
MKLEQKLFLRREKADAEAAAAAAATATAAAAAAAAPAAVPPSAASQVTRRKKPVAVPAEILSEDKEAQAADPRCTELIALAQRVKATRVAYAEAILVYNAEPPHFRQAGATAVRRARHQHADAVDAANRFWKKELGEYNKHRPLPAVPDIFPDAAALPLLTVPVLPILKDWVAHFCPKQTLQGLEESWSGLEGL